MLKQLTEFILPLRREPSTCEACGQLFNCGASLTGCWCLSVRLDETTRQRLRAQYRDCLCQTCLERLAQQEPADQV